VSDFEIDWEREQRTGVAEAMLCVGKSAAQIDAILEAAAGRHLLLTRLDPDKRTGLRAELDYDPLSGTAFFGAGAAATLPGVGIVCAGTSDLPVAQEAARTLGFHGYDAPVIADVGVAGLWRLTARLDEIRRHRVVIVAAGMDAALPSVLGGLVAAPLIAVPTSVGYGVAAGGQTALNAMLASCAPGVVVVNIDNGYGAACAALRVLNRTIRGR
jgi:NCAIR mutase (PurE)-related protein